MMLRHYCAAVEETKVGALGAVHVEQCNCTMTGNRARGVANLCLNAHSDLLPANRSLFRHVYSTIVSLSL